MEMKPFFISIYLQNESGVFFDILVGRRAGNNVLRPTDSGQEICSRAYGRGHEGRVGMLYEIHSFERRQGKELFPQFGLDCEGVASSGYREAAGEVECAPVAGRVDQPHGTVAGCSDRVGPRSKGYETRVSAGLCFCKRRREQQRGEKEKGGKIYGGK